MKIAPTFEVFYVDILPNLNKLIFYNLNSMYSFQIKSKNQRVFSSARAILKRANNKAEIVFKHSL